MDDTTIWNIRQGAFACIYHWTKKRELSEDIAHDVILKILERKVEPKFTSECKQFAYGSTVAYRLWIDMKRKRTCPCLYIIPEMTTVEDEINHTLYGITDQELYEAVEKLPRSQRDYVKNVLFGKKLNREYAEETGENIHTLTSRSIYAKRNLKKLLTTK